MRFVCCKGVQSLPGSFKLWLHCYRHAQVMQVKQFIDIILPYSMGIHTIADNYNSDAYLNNDDYLVVCLNN